MQHLYNLSGEELYNKAQEFLLLKNYNDYAIYMIMAANYDYAGAINDIIDDKILKKQNYDLTGSFYIETSEDICLEKNNFSIYWLANMYRSGIHVEHDYNKAIELYKKSIDKGCIYSITSLAYTYRSIEKYTEAIELYEIGISKGLSGCYNNLAYMYINELGIEKDYDKAEKLLQIAVEKNNIVALNNLATLYTRNFFADKKDDIVQYFNKINRTDKLVQIYNFDEYTITLIKNNYKLKNKNASLKTKNNDLKTHIAASPDGILYLEAKKEWDTYNKG